MLGIGRNKQQDPFKEELEVRRSAYEMEAASDSRGVASEELHHIQQERAQLTRWQQDLAEQVDVMKHLLRREQLNEAGAWKRVQIKKRVVIKGKDVWAIEESDPMCNEECIQEIIALIAPSTSKNLMMSKFREEQILDIMKKLCLTLVWDILLAKRRRYEIELPDVSVIYQIFKTTAMPTYFRALGANEKDYLTRLRKELSVSRQGMDEQKKRSFLGL